MAFSEARALPGAALKLQLGAAPGSLCAVRAVDRSVLLLKPEAELNAEAVSAGPAWGPPAAPGAAWAGHGMTLAHMEPVLWWLLGRALCSENEVFAHLYSQIYKALPEFNYPHSIQDEPPCYFYWRDAKMETYKLFQVKPLSAWASRFFPIQEPPMLLPSAGEVTLVAKDFPFLPSPGSSTCFLKLWDYSLLEWGYCSCWLWEVDNLCFFTGCSTEALHQCQDQGGLHAHVVHVQVPRCWNGRSWR